MNKAMRMNVEILVSDWEASCCSSAIKFCPLMLGSVNLQGTLETNRILVQLAPVAFSRPYSRSTLAR